MVNQRMSKPHGVQLFEARSGPVRAVVIGPRIGFRWRTLKYYRVQSSNKDPGKWVEISSSWRANDNRHLAYCVKAVQRFLDEEES